MICRAAPWEDSTPSVRPFGSQCRHHDYLLFRVLTRRFWPIKKYLLGLGHSCLHGMPPTRATTDCFGHSTRLTDLPHWVGFPVFDSKVGILPRKTLLDIERATPIILIIRLLMFTFTSKDMVARILQLPHAEQLFGGEEQIRYTNQDFKLFLAGDIMKKALLLPGLILTSWVPHARASKGGIRRTRIDRDTIG